MDSFSLDIDLGNAAMQDAADVAHALRDVADRLDGSAGTDGPIHDDNGNRVGGWGFDQLADKRTPPERDMIPVNRNVLAALCRSLEAGQHARAKRHALAGFEDAARGLRGSGDAFREAGERIAAGTIGDVSVSGALDRILTA